MKAAIVGCGIDGMAAAIGLARHGHEVTLFEAFDTPRPLGSGLRVQPSGLAALRHLGLEDQARAAGAQVDRLDGRDRSGRRILDLDYGRWRRGTHGVGINRHDLFTLLYDAARETGIRIVTATPIVAIEYFDRPRLRSGQGEVFEEFDLAVVADGSASRLRSQIRPRARAPVYPWGAVWTNCPDPSGAFSGALRQLYHGVEIMIGALPIGGGQVSFFWSLPVTEQDAFFTQDFAAWKARVADLWPDAAPLLAGMTNAEGFSRAVYRDVTVGRWSRGACVLIGDAAHGTSPQLGQGANLALLDAVELADHLEGPPAKSVRRYQVARRRQTALYQFVSRFLTPLFQSSDRRWLPVRDWVFTPLTRAPILRWFVAGGLTGTGRLGITPRCVRL